MNKLYILIILSCFLFSNNSAHAASPLVSVDWVKNHIGKEGVVFLDVRGPLAGKTKADYLRGHIPGAIWTDYLMGGWRVANKDKIVGVITDASYFGETTYYKVECGLNAQALTISSQNSFNQVNYKIGDNVELIADMNSVVGFRE